MSYTKLVYLLSYVFYCDMEKKTHLFILTFIKRTRNKHNFNRNSTRTLKMDDIRLQVQYLI